MPVQRLIPSAGDTPPTSQAGQGRCARLDGPWEPVAPPDFPGDLQIGWCAWAETRTCGLGGENHFHHHHRRKSRAAAQKRLPVLGQTGRKNVFRCILPLSVSGSGVLECPNSWQNSKSGRESELTSWLWRPMSISSPTLCLALSLAVNPDASEYFPTLQIRHITHIIHWGRGICQ